jgi:hypothetical protein
MPILAFRHQVGHLKWSPKDFHVGSQGLSAIETSIFSMSAAETDTGS